MIKLNDIKNPDYVKNLNIHEMIELSKELNKFILNEVSINGGHLSSNLGVIDLTIALLKVFDVNKDIIIYDVGHQCYAYKILTGRLSRFNTLRKKDGLSGFQSINESKYDHYEAGHSSTSLSAATGFSIARDLDKKDYNIISIIGDGAFANGLSYEALNHIGSIPNKQIIILNDNQMSISKNVGAMHNFLDSIRGGKSYNFFKEKTVKSLKIIPLGKYLYTFLDKIKTSLKRLYIKKGSVFNDLGLEYYGPINGHDFNELIKYLTIAKNEKKSVILHVITKKGIGYKLAENDVIGKYHGIGPFNINTGELKISSNLPSYSEIISSFVFNYAKKDKDIICITPGMCYGSNLNVIKEKLPNQYIDVGINEEHSLILANSLALSGKKPIVFIYSTFLQRGYDELVHDICRMDQNVTLCIDRAGLVSGDGISHQGIFDISFMMSIPNMIISMPKDSKEANDLIYTSINTNHPFAIRYPKINLKYDYNRGHILEIGSWEELIDGEDGTIITYGDFVERAIEITKLLNNKNINLKIINARFIKPIDTKIFSDLMKKNKPIFVYEESLESTSLGAYLSKESMNYNEFNNKIYTIGIPNEYINIGTRDELIKDLHLDKESVEKYIINKIRSK